MGYSGAEVLWDEVTLWRGYCKMDVLWEEVISRRGHCGVGYSVLRLVCCGATEGRGILWTEGTFRRGYFQEGTVGWGTVRWG